MTYKFISFSFNVSPFYSRTREIWQDIKTGDYYIDDPAGNIMLHPGVTDMKKDYYKERLSQYAKKITQEEISSGIIDGAWKFTTRKQLIA